MRPETKPRKGRTPSSWMRALDRTRRKINIAAFLALFAVWGTAQGTTVIPPDFDSLVRRAELIFVGQVRDVRSEWAGEQGKRCIVSYVTFDVDKVLKGSSQSPYVLKMLGGTVGETTMGVSDAPKFKAGDRTLLFVENNGTQFVPLVGVMYGCYRIEKDPATGEETVLKHNGRPLGSVREIDDAHQRGLSAGHGEARETPAARPLKRGEFEEQIQRKLASQGR